MRKLPVDWCFERVVKYNDIAFDEPIFKSLEAFRCWRKRYEKEVDPRYDVASLYTEEVGKFVPSSEEIDYEASNSFNVRWRKRDENRPKSCRIDDNDLFTNEETRRFMALCKENKWRPPSETRHRTPAS